MIPSEKHCFLLKHSHNLMNISMNKKIFKGFLSTYCMQIYAYLYPKHLIKEKTCFHPSPTKRGN